ncbi:MAG: hypothetical protein ABIR94_23755, partial [Rubrivivax sp.]
MLRCALAQQSVRGARAGLKDFAAFGDVESHGEQAKRARRKEPSDKPARDPRVRHTKRIAPALAEQVEQGARDHLGRPPQIFQVDMLVGA